MYLENVDLNGLNVEAIICYKSNQRRRNHLDSTSQVISLAARLVTIEALDL